MTQYGLCKGGRTRCSRNNAEVILLDPARSGADEHRETRMAMIASAAFGLSSVAVRQENTRYDIGPCQVAVEPRGSVPRDGRRGSVESKLVGGSPKGRRPPNALQHGDGSQSIRSDPTKKG